ncbi:MAG: hypothetical protein LQ340_003870 [Diploschistes diacapsis]|nr:MAG: hypothetical protein LQ340_003870 [Diploschistes diacapsis]
MDPQRNQDFHKLSRSPVSVATVPNTDNVQVMDEEAIPDVDEPPDETLFFRRQPIRCPTFPETLPTLGSTLKSTHADQKSRQQSLLTQGLLTISAPEPFQREHVPSGPRSARSTYSNGSLASATELTSDGLTSPTRTSTPSPPLPPTTFHLPPTNDAKQESQDKRQDPVSAVPVEQPRKPRITFACARPGLVKAQAPSKPAEPAQAPATQRCTTLKFACPTRPKETAEDRDRTPSRISNSPRASKTHNKDTAAKGARFFDKDETPKKAQASKLSSASPMLTKKKPWSEALRFHEFASSRVEDDEWTKEKPRRMRKITVNDTLKKENAIRKLGEEAEAEALEEEEEEDDVVEDEDDEAGDDGDNGDSDADSSDGGNETDDEEGFAASDDESEYDPEYQFWTPGLTTAATSTEHVEQIRNRQKRTASESSIESAIHNGHAQPWTFKGKTSRRQARPKMRPSTPELPDSTDFVCGTLDEDRPLEAAYLSCLEQRKLSKHGITPQDVDPSFPTSDPEQEDSDDDDEEAGSESQAWIAGKPDESDGGRCGRCLGDGGMKSNRSPSISPKGKASPAPRRRKSPAPPTSKRGNICRSPPPRRLFGQSPKRQPSSPNRNPASPPCSRKPSYDGKSIVISQLAQRPHLTHTKSLPRTPNPFWQEHRHSQVKDHKHRPTGAGKGSNEVRSRGPIDIVQGLEKKRQRRKEKFLLMHCRNGGKEKDRRCQPGKGAERMREVGLEMAGRCKGYGQRLQLVLSV